MTERYLLGADNLRLAFRSLRDRDIPGVMHRALNDTAKEAREAETTRIGQVFEAPTPYTMRAVYSTFANRSNLTAFVGIRSRFGGRGAEGRQASYLGVHEMGGGRPHTRFEFRLISAGVMDQGEWVVPASGKVGRGVYTQVLSQVSALREGSKSNSARSKRARKRSGSIFVTGGRETRIGGVDLPRGIWRRQGIVIEPLFWITRKRPQYTPRLGFEETVRETGRTRFIAHARAQAARTIVRNRARGYV